MSRRPVSEGGTPNLPTIEKPEHQEMYKFYESLGDKRTLQKVATQFNKSKSFIQLLSRAFGWKHRIHAVESRPIDPVIKDTQAQVDDVRRKLVSVVQDVADTLYELMFIAKAQKIGTLDEAGEKRAVQLYKALSIWGFTWKTPGQFKQLIQTLKEISDFNSSGGNGKGGTRVGNATQINADKFELHITDD